MNHFLNFVSFVGVTKVQILFNQDQMSHEDLATILREQNAGGESSTTANPFGRSVESTTTANPFGGSVESTTTANPLVGWGVNPFGGSGVGVSGTFG